MLAWAIWGDFWIQIQVEQGNIYMYTQCLPFFFNGHAQVSKRRLCFFLRLQTCWTS